MHPIKCSIFTLALLLVLPFSGLAQTGMIRGKIRNLGGSTINDALVELKQGTGGGITSQMSSRNDGDFVFQGLRPGTYEIVVTMSGYESTAQTVQLGNTNIIGRGNSDNPGEVVNIEIRLRPRSGTAPAPPASTFVQDVPEAARKAYEKGMAKMQEGKAAEGMALLQEAVAKFNIYYDAYMALGVAYFQQGKDKEALESLEHARQVYDRGAAVYYLFGMIMAKEQKFGLAEYGFGKAVEYNDSHMLAHFNHAVSLIEVALRTTDPKDISSYLDEGEHELDRAWELSGKRQNGVFLQRARILEKRGNRESAARELETYLKAEPGAKNASAIQEKIKKLRESQKPDR